MIASHTSGSVPGTPQRWDDIRFYGCSGGELRLGPEVVHDLQHLVVGPHGLGRCIHSLRAGAVAPDDDKADKSHPAACWI